MKFSFLFPFPSLPQEKMLSLEPKKMHFKAFFPRFICSFPPFPMPTEWSLYPKKTCNFKDFFPVCYAIFLLFPFPEQQTPQPPRFVLFCSVFRGAKINFSYVPMNKVLFHFWECICAPVCFKSD